MAENYKKVFIIFVLILLFSPFFIGFIEKDLVASQVEKRKLAPFQDIYNVKTFKEVFNSFEAYLNDHFGLRENYISLYHGVKRLLPKRYDLKSSVIEGKDGWLFLRDGLELYLGNRSNEGIQKFIQNLEGFIKQVSPIPVVMVAVPSKAFVMEEKLPEYILDNKSSQRDSVIIQKLKTLEGLCFLDVLSILQKEELSTYIKQDTHWNGWGAYLAYREIIKSINVCTPLTLYVKAEGIKAIDDRMVRGDLANFLGLPANTLSLSNKVILEKASAIPTEKSRYLSNNGRFYDYTNEKLSTKVFILHDSFLKYGLGVLLAESFGEIINFWSYDFKKAQEFIAEEKPDFILIEVVDRFIK